MSYTAKDGARTRSCHLHTLAEENVCTSDKPCRHVLDRTRVVDCSNRGSVDDDSVVKEKQEVVPAHAITTTRFVTSSLLHFFPFPLFPLSLPHRHSFGAAVPAPSESVARSAALPFSAAARLLLSRDTDPERLWLAGPFILQLRQRPRQSRRDGRHPHPTKQHACALA